MSNWEQFYQHAKTHHTRMGSRHSSVKKISNEKRCKKTRKNQVHHTTPSILAQTKYPTSSQQSFHLSTDQVTKFYSSILPSFNRPSNQVHHTTPSIFPQTKHPSSAHQLSHFTSDQVSNFITTILPSFHRPSSAHPSFHCSTNEVTKSSTSILLPFHKLELQV